MVHQLQLARRRVRLGATERVHVDSPVTAAQWAHHPSFLRLRCRCQLCSQALPALFAAVTGVALEVGPHLKHAPHHDAPARHGRGRLLVWKRHVQKNGRAAVSADGLDNRQSLWSDAVPGWRNPDACMTEHVSDRAHFRDTHVAVSRAEEEEEAGPHVGGLLWRLARQQAQALAAPHQVMTSVPRGPNWLRKLAAGREEAHFSARRAGRPLHGSFAGVELRGRQPSHITRVLNYLPTSWLRVRLACGTYSGRSIQYTSYTLSSTR